MNECVHGCLFCLFLCRPAMDWRPVQGENSKLEQRKSQNDINALSSQRLNLTFFRVKLSGPGESKPSWLQHHEICSGLYLVSESFIRKADNRTEQTPEIHLVWERNLIKPGSDS
ncbi:hypothetical protein AMECASPLE_038429 [Ameca splendens]|uniref:Uncharacterized protein n=1 Tax=Ameca splendens TaxID=208324 RepID=A0ABV0YJB2_9TELE